MPTSLTFTGNRFSPRLSAVNGSIYVASGVEFLTVDVFDLNAVTGELVHVATRGPIDGPNAFKWGWSPSGQLHYGLGSEHRVYNAVTGVTRNLGPATIGANHARDGVIVAYAAGLVSVGAKSLPAAGLWDTRDGFVFFPADTSNQITTRWHVASGALESFPHPGAYAVKAGPAGSACYIADRVRELHSGTVLNAAPWSNEGILCSWKAGDGQTWVCTANNDLPRILLRPVSDPTNVIALPPGAEDADVIDVGDYLVIASAVTRGGGQSELTVQTVRRDVTRQALVKPSEPLPEPPPPVITPPTPVPVPTPTPVPEPEPTPVPNDGQDDDEGDEGDDDAEPPPLTRNQIIAAVLTLGISRLWAWWNRR